MILIRTDWSSFEEYVASLNKPARKNYKAVQKEYSAFEYSFWVSKHGVGFPTDDVRKFMRLWERQLIRGKTVQWAFPVETVEQWAKNGDIQLFKATLNGEDVAMHFIQKRDGYWECHPPMYDKIRYPSLAKWMWFNLIRYAVDIHSEPLDMGGGSDDWRYNLEHRNEFPNPRYKWMYVPEYAKNFPESDPSYYIERPSCRLLIKN